jgi:hypothetical protein
MRIPRNWKGVKGPDNSATGGYTSLTTHFLGLESLSDFLPFSTVQTIDYSDD